MRKAQKAARVAARLPQGKFIVGNRTSPSVIAFLRLPSDMARRTSFVFVSGATAGWEDGEVGLERHSGMRQTNLGTR